MSGQTARAANGSGDLTDFLWKLAYEFFPLKVETGSLDLTDGPQHYMPGTADDETLLKKMRASKSNEDGVSFSDLFDANVERLAAVWPATPDSKSGLPYDGSSADQSLANRFAWWTGGDGERVKRLMLREDCGLRRDKYDRPDYLKRTIGKALALVAQNPPKDKTMTVPKFGGTLPAGASTVPDVVPGNLETDSRPIIELTGGELDSYVERAERMIADIIYVRGGKLVRIGRASEIVNSEGGIKRDAAQAVCIPASSGWLRRILMKRARFVKYDKRSHEWEYRDCPKDLADNISDQVEWAAFRPLVAMSSVPVLRPDLSVYVAPGYDEVTGIYYQPTLNFPPIPVAPTRNDAQAALARMFEPFDQFPYATPEARSAFLCHIVTEILRASIDKAPIFLYTAPDVANGKTLLASMPPLIAHGGTPAQSPYSEGEELRKVLFASLLAGDSSVIFDNLPNGTKIRAPILCAFVTSPVWSDRVLGASDKRGIPNRITVAITGNNVTPAGDLPRRSLTVRLNVKKKSARGRTFRIADLPAYVLARRAQMIVDALTIVRAYACAGYPKVVEHPLESCEQWSRLVRDPLVWLGEADPVKTQETEADDDAELLPEAFAAIAAATATIGHRFTAAQLSGLVVGSAFAASGVSLRDALIEGGCAEPADAKKLGYWLREYRDRIAGDWVLEHENGQDKGKRGVRWRIVPAG